MVTENGISAAPFLSKLIPVAVPVKDSYEKHNNQNSYRFCYWSSLNVNWRLGYDTGNLTNCYDRKAHETICRFLV